MSLSIEFLDRPDHRQAFGMSLSIGDIVVRSSPGSLGENYRDLMANRHFLARRQLAKLFVGEQPLVNLSYDDEKTVTAYRYRRVEYESEKLTGKFEIAEALSHIDKLLELLELELDAAHLDSNLLSKQLEDDIYHGVYGVYLNENASAAS